MFVRFPYSNRCEWLSDKDECHCLGDERSVCDRERDAARQLEGSGVTRSIKLEETRGQLVLSTASSPLSFLHPPFPPSDFTSIFFLLVRAELAGSDHRVVLDLVIPPSKQAFKFLLLPPRSFYKHTPSVFNSPVPWPQTHFL